MLIIFHNSIAPIRLWCGVVVVVVVGVGKASIKRLKNCQSIVQGLSFVMFYFKLWFLCLTIRLLTSFYSRQYACVVVVVGKASVKTKKYQSIVQGLSLFYFILNCAFLRLTIRLLTSFYCHQNACVVVGINILTKSQSIVQGLSLFYFTLNCAFLRLTIRLLTYFYWRQYVCGDVVVAVVGVEKASVKRQKKSQSILHWFSFVLFSFKLYFLCLTIRIFNICYMSNMSMS